MAFPVGKTVTEPMTGYAEVVFDSALSLSSSTGDTRTSRPGCVILTTGGWFRVTFTTISLPSLLVRPSLSTSRTLNRIVSESVIFAR